MAVGQVWQPSEVVQALQTGGAVFPGTLFTLESPYCEVTMLKRGGDEDFAIGLCASTELSKGVPSSGWAVLTSGNIIDNGDEKVGAIAPVIGGGPQVMRATQ